MKKLLYLLFLFAFLTSCASHPGRFCGDGGVGRVVENAQIKKPIYNKHTV